MEEVMPLSDRGWMLLTRRLMLFFFGLAVLNEAIWRTQTEETWVWFKTFGLTAAIFAFFMAQGALFRDHALPEEDSDKEDGA
jgi:intracellular septation protein